MSDERPHPLPDYLWDRSGHPEPDLVRLEQLLGGIRERCPIPELGPLPAATPRRRPAIRIALLAAAAAAVFALGGPAVRVWLTPWTVTTIEGTAMLDERRSRRLPVCTPVTHSRRIWQLACCCKWAPSAVSRLHQAPGFASWPRISGNIGWRSTGDA